MMLEGRRRKAQGARHEEFGIQKSDIRSQKSDIRSQRCKVKAIGRWRKTQLGAFIAKLRRSDVLEKVLMEGWKAGR